jgi:hypothetical protein
MNFPTLCKYSSPFQPQSCHESLHARPRLSSITVANTSNSHYPPPYNYVEYFSEANNFTLICEDATSWSGCTLPSDQNPWNATIDAISNWGLNLHLRCFGFYSKFCHCIGDWPWIGVSQDLDALEFWFKTTSWKLKNKAFIWLQRTSVFRPPRLDFKITQRRTP